MTDDGIKSLPLSSSASKRVTKKLSNQIEIQLSPLFMYPKNKNVDKVVQSFWGNHAFNAIITLKVKRFWEHYIFPVVNKHQKWNLIKNNNWERIYDFFAASFLCCESESQRKKTKSKLGPQVYVAVWSPNLLLCQVPSWMPQSAWLQS